MHYVCMCASVYEYTLFYINDTHTHHTNILIYTNTQNTVQRISIDVILCPGVSHAGIWGTTTVAKRPSPRNTHIHMHTSHTHKYNCTRHIQSKRLR